VLPSVAADSDDNIFIVRRAPPAILIYDRQGRYLKSWGESVLHMPHSVWVGGDEVFVTDTKDHTVRLFTKEGELIRTWGTEFKTGAPGEPFNKPTWAIRSQSGDIYVTDGYGQQFVHRFTSDGDLLETWGGEGDAPGKFSLPHCVREDPRGRILILDRNPNSRLQAFDREGNFLEEWTDMLGPNDICIDRDNIAYVAEGNYFVSVWTLDGELLDRWGEEKNTPSDLFQNAPHGICVDSHGDLYITEVPYVDNRLQKFERI
jgi:sugar lactone lactonase YvrE